MKPNQCKYLYKYVIKQRTCYRADHTTTMPTKEYNRYGGIASRSVLHPPPQALRPAAVGIDVQVPANAEDIAFNCPALAQHPCFPAVFRPTEAWICHGPGRVT